jgi:hypothetical protein
MVLLVNSYFSKGKEIKYFCKHNGIEYLDIDINEKKDSLIWGSSDAHWNKKANTIIFRHIMPEIKELVKENSSLQYLSN